MKALTIHQPWAELIVSGKKTVENRTWFTSHRGPLLIHAGKSRASLRLYGAADLKALEFGVAVGVVDVVGCVPLKEAPAAEFTEGPWCWVLRHARRLSRPVPLRGMPGLFDVRDDLLDWQGELHRLVPARVADELERRRQA